MSKRPPIIRRTDNNQSEIVSDLRNLGCRIVDIHIIGAGVPDLIVTFCGFAVLVEIKSASAKLTPDEQTFREMWRGPYVVARCAEDVMKWFTDACEGKTGE